MKDDHGPIIDALARVALLVPRRVTWKDSPEAGERDGFFAHEVAAAVPEAVDGEKDAVATEEDVAQERAGVVGEVVPQQIETSKLIPLLTAALQAALDRVDTLEARVTALEAP